LCEGSVPKSRSTSARQPRPGKSTASNHRRRSSLVSSKPTVRRPPSPRLSRSTKSGRAIKSGSLFGSADGGFPFAARWIAERSGRYSVTETGRVDRRRACLSFSRGCRGCGCSGTSSWQTARPRRSGIKLLSPQAGTKGCDRRFSRSSRHFVVLQHGFIDFGN
jgi:hypothetical protein